MTNYVNMQNTRVHLHLGVLDKLFLHIFLFFSFSLKPTFNSLKLKGPSDLQHIFRALLRESIFTFCACAYNDFRGVLEGIFLLLGKLFQVLKKWLLCDIRGLKFRTIILCHPIKKKP